MPVNQRKLISGLIFTITLLKLEILDPPKSKSLVLQYLREIRFFFLNKSQRIYNLNFTL